MPLESLFMQLFNSARVQLCGWVIALVLTSLRNQLEDTCFINQPHKFHTRQSTITSVVASSSFCSSETLSLSPFLHSVSKKA